VTDPRQNDPVDQDRTDEDRAISDVGLPHGGDDDRTDDTAAAVGGHDEDVDGGPVAEEAALDEVFPAEDGRS
jgi:hypothetical protein